MHSSCVDLIILGGGCAGLSLARYLSCEVEWHKHTLIIEARPSYFNDRSWCFWEPADLDLQKHLAPIISHRWQQWRFTSKNFAEVHQADGRDYCYVPANEFYRQAISAIDASEYLTLQTGQSVLNVEREGQGFLLTLADHTKLYAGRIIDTRPPVYLHASQARLWQIFYGYEIETREAIFDKAIVGLMEDLTATSSAMQFVYRLPFSKTRALIEMTQFSRKLFTPEKLISALNDYLEQSIGSGNFTIIRHEYGCLPMGLRQYAKSKFVKYHYGGTNAGAIRPATGYGFIRIQKWARGYARELALEKKSKITLSTSKIASAMDDIFLRVLHDNPMLGPHLFRALGECVSGPALVRFLMDEATFSDYCEVIRAFPKLRFIIYSLGLNRLIYSSVES